MADDVFKQLPDNHPKKKYFKQSGKRHRCTCFGSKVCGYYSDKTDKNTNIGFVRVHMKINLLIILIHLKDRTWKMNLM